jgi:hypothetical protein
VEFSEVEQRYVDELADRGQGTRDVDWAVGLDVFCRLAEEAISDLGSVEDTDDGDFLMAEFLVEPGDDQQPPAYRVWLTRRSTRAGARLVVRMGWYWTRPPVVLTWGPLRVEGLGHQLPGWLSSSEFVDVLRHCDQTQCLRTVGPSDEGTFAARYT